jgi:hypothetical protein
MRIVNDEFGRPDHGGIELVDPLVSTTSPLASINTGCFVTVSPVLGVVRIWCDMKATSTVEGYLKPLLPNHTILPALTWLLSNSMFDPVQEHKVILITGRGCSGKRIVEICMTGCVKPISGSVFADAKMVALPDRTIPGIVGLRIALGGDVNFVDGIMNTQMMKTLLATTFWFSPRTTLCVCERVPA